MTCVQIKVYVSVGLVALNKHQDKKATLNYIHKLHHVNNNSKETEFHKFSFSLTVIQSSKET